MEVELNSSSFQSIIIHNPEDIIQKHRSSKSLKGTQKSKFLPLPGFRFSFPLYGLL